MFKALLHPNDSAISTTSRILCNLHFPFSHKLLTTTTTTSTPSFAVSYFINNLKFSSESALKASKLVHFKTSKKPDSVLNFFRTHGFTDSDIHKIIQREPWLLSYDTQKRVLPKFQFLPSLKTPYSCKNDTLSTLFSQIRDGFTKPTKRRVVGLNPAPRIDAHCHLCQLHPHDAPDSLPIHQPLVSPNRSDRRRPLPRRRRIRSSRNHPPLRSTISQQPKLLHIPRRRFSRQPPLRILPINLRKRRPRSEASLPLLLSNFCIRLQAASSTQPLFNTNNLCDLQQLIPFCLSNSAVNSASHWSRIIDTISSTFFCKFPL